jgi:hypothetical protein
MTTDDPAPIPDAEVVDRAADLVRRLAALPEVGMRSAGLVAALARAEPRAAIWFVELLIRGVLGRNSSSLRVYAGIAFPESLPGGLASAHLDAMLSVGRAEGCVAAVQWLLSPQAGRSEDQIESDRLIDATLRDVPLGSRRALARRARGETINRLARDPDFGVITNLLDNPRVTEQTVMRISSRRPTVSAALEAVMRSRRWGTRYRVRLSLVENPYLAQKFAINLLPFLNRRDLVSVRDDESLAPSLRLAAQRLLDL